MAGGVGGAFALVAPRVCVHTLTSSGEKMAATKITVNHNGSIRVEGDFGRKALWLDRADDHRALPLRALRKQAVL